jgi:hypothetical protein
MWLYIRLLEYSDHASEVLECTPLQRRSFWQRRDRCFDEFWAVANRILSTLPFLLDVKSLNLPLTYKISISNNGWKND